MKLNLKKIFIVFLIILIVIMIITYFIRKNKTQISNEEYQPEEEISQEQERQTMLSLYFVNKSTRKIEPEARLIDVKELIENPYEKIVNMLIEGPKNENYEKAIPEGTMLIGTELEDDVLKINFSSEFIDNHAGGKEEEEKTIESIVNSVTELTEVNAVKILINGEENKAFNDNAINFSQNFIRND